MYYIVATLITGLFSIIVALIQKTRKENKQDHGLVIMTLTGLRDEVKDVADKLDGHIDWHLKDK